MALQHLEPANHAGLADIPALDGGTGSHFFNLEQVDFRLTLVICDIPPRDPTGTRISANPGWY